MEKDNQSTNQSKKSIITNKLNKEGAQIVGQHRAEASSVVHGVVGGPCVMASNPEFKSLPVPLITLVPTNPSKFAYFSVTIHHKSYLPHKALKY